jgi:3D (Asp-Asp-Asp) domain-containing protein
VFSSGPNKGKPKEVGVTASGAEARRGTVAADTSVLPMGTILYIPGYGWGRVEDRGGAIKGKRLDLFFDSHKEALEWGRQQLDVKVWRR